MAVQILRLGHRPGRDSRISTHVGLVARALGADGITYSGDRDGKMMESIDRITGEFGGDFTVTYDPEWKRLIKEFDGVVVHLTMYGLPIEEMMDELEAAAGSGDLLVVVGGGKVPAEIYNLADCNVGVTNQPHSEVGALAVLLWELGLGKEFAGAKRVVEPSESSKNYK